jgi:hypothetical protein
MIGQISYSLTNVPTLTLCRYLHEKARIIAEQGQEVVQSYPENDGAAGELLELLVDCEYRLVQTRSRL